MRGTVAGGAVTSCEISKVRGGGRKLEAIRIPAEVVLFCGRDPTNKLAAVLEVVKGEMALEAVTKYEPLSASCALAMEYVVFVAPAMATAPLPLSNFHWYVIGILPLNVALICTLPPTYTADGVTVVSATSTGADAALRFNVTTELVAVLLTLVTMT